MSGGSDGGPAFPVCSGYEGAITDRFLQYVCVGEWLPSSCWTWTGGRTASGYGAFALSHSKQIRAHRYAFEIHYGRKPNGMVLHSCDNRICCNPLHLREGKHGDNMKDMSARKRAAREERHHKAKLKRAEVLAIHCLYSTSDYSTYELAEIFGMAQPTIGQIVQGNLWPDVRAEADAMLAEREKSNDH